MPFGRVVFRSSVVVPGRAFGDGAREAAYEMERLEARTAGLVVQHAKGIDGMRTSEMC